MNTTQTARKRATYAVPPAVGGETEITGHKPRSHYARLEGDPIAVLMRLRDEAASEIDRLLAFLDATEGDIDFDQCCEDEGADCEDEGAFEDNGIADLDGLMEQCPAMFEGHDMQVLA